jgi:hypothetical protein
MSQFNFPSDLGPGVWGKQQSALKKAAAPATKLGDEMRDLANQHLKVDWDLFSADKVATAAEVEERSKKLAIELKTKVDKLAEQAKSVAKAANDFQTEAKKKGKDFPKELLTAAADIAGAALKYVKDLATVQADAEHELEAKLNKAKAGDKKAGAAPGKESKGAKLVRTRTLDAIRMVKKPKPGAKPIRFLVVQGKLSARVYMGVSVGPTQEKLLKALIPTEAPFKVFKDPASELMWEKNSLTFVSDRLPAGLAKKLQQGLRLTTKLNIRVRVRKTTGEAEEGDAAPDLADDMLKGDPADAQAAAAAGKDFEKRLAAMKDDIRRALKGPSAAEISDLIASIAKHGKAQDFEAAGTELDEIEALLEEGADEGAGAGASAPADAGGGGLSVRALGKARLEWMATRDVAIKQITVLSSEIVKLMPGAPGLKDAITRLGDLQKRLRTGLEDELDAALNEDDPGERAKAVARAKASLASVSKLLDEELMQQLDGNEVVPSMKIVAPMKMHLDSISKALGAA